MKPKVSVLIITYMHEDFIEEAIDSVLMQNVDFPVEIIISNDCSPDKTDDKIRIALKKNIPNNFTIHYTKHQENLGSNPNFVWSLRQAKGEYIAICERDDFWTDQLKLKKQIEFLDEHPDFSMYFHKSEDAANKILQEIEDRQYTAKELLTNWYIHTASTVFINNFTQEDFSLLENKKIHFYDIILFMIMENKGKVWGTNEKMSYYRFVPSSITNKEKDITYYKSLLSHLEVLAAMFEGKYRDFTHKNVSNQAYKIFRYYSLRFNPIALKYWLKYLKYK